MISVIDNPFKQMSDFQYTIEQNISDNGVSSCQLDSLLLFPTGHVCYRSQTAITRGRDAEKS